MSLITKKRVTTTFFITLLISLITMATPVYLAVLFESSSSAALSYFAAYLNFYLLLPLLGILLIILIIQNFNQLSIYEATKEISLQILSILLSFLIVDSGVKLRKYQDNKLEVVLVNKTDTKIKYIKLHGRNALTEVDSLSANSDTVVVFRGKEINYDTENDYENEVTLLYYFGSKWREEKILEGFDRWRVFNDPFKLEIFGADSVKFSYQ